MLFVFGPVPVEVFWKCNDGEKEVEENEEEEKEGEEEEEEEEEEWEEGRKGSVVGRSELDA